MKKKPNLDIVLGAGSSLGASLVEADVFKFWAALGPTLGDKDGIEEGAELVELLVFQKYNLQRLSTILNAWIIKYN